MNRLLGALIVVLWLVALSAVLVRDVVPYWRTQSPPSGKMPSGDYQTGIYTAGGERIGTSWTSLNPQPDMLTVHSNTLLDGRLPLPTAVVASLSIDSTFSVSAPDNRLVGFELTLRHDGEQVAELRGHQVGEDYACVAQVGELTRHFSLDARATSVLTESLRPFNHLPNLRVGQSWRIRMLDPVALLRDQTAATVPQLVRVTGRETIDHGGLAVACFRIETDGATAWADDTGRVLRQRVELPLLGRFELRDEPFDQAARAKARRRAAGQTGERPARGSPKG